MRLRDHAFPLLLRFDDCLQRDFPASFQFGCHEPIGWINYLIASLSEPSFILCPGHLVFMQLCHSIGVCLLISQDFFQEIELGRRQCLEKSLDDHCFQAGSVYMQTRGCTIICSQRRTGVASLGFVRDPHLVATPSAYDQARQKSAALPWGPMGSPSEIAGVVRQARQDSARNCSQVIYAGYTP